MYSIARTYNIFSTSTQSRTTSQAAIFLYRKFGHQEVLFAPLLWQLNTVIKLLIHISPHIDRNSTYKINTKFS